MSDYREGVKVRKEFEHTMTELFRAPKPKERKQPKATEQRPKSDED